MDEIDGVLHVELPVRGELLLEAALRQLKLAGGRAVDHVVDRLGDVAQIVREARPLRSLAREDEAAIALDPRYAGKAARGIVEIEARAIAGRQRHRGERAIGTERPGVIGTDEGAGMAA